MSDPQPEPTAGTGTDDSASSRFARVRAELLRWYALWGRHDLDWRLSRDPYEILVSEVMLQQTQVSRVLPYYHDWLERWPTVQALAAAPVAEVIRQWSGLGYNRRARHLHSAAIAIVEEHGGEFPSTVEGLLRLPGIGPYTARAVASFAFEIEVPVVEANTGRSIARFGHGVERARDVSPRHLWATAEVLLPPVGARDHNLALMDHGAMICTARNPLCGQCPIAAGCAWLAAGQPPSMKSSTAPAVPFEETARFARGRIVHLLRGAEAPVLREEIAAYLPEGHRDEVDTYLAALTREGLAEQHGDGGWQLPGG